MNLNRRWFFICILVSLMATTSALAQDCPASIILALSRTVGLCLSTERDSACYGSGSMSVRPFPGYEDQAANFIKPGDKLPTSMISRLTSQPPTEADWNAAVLKIRGNLPVTDQRSVTLFLLGGVNLENRVEPIPQINLTARANANLRALPEADAEISARVNVNSVLAANGVTREGDWFRVTVPNTDTSGWVSSEVIIPNGDVNTLAVVDASTPIHHPFDDFRVETSVDDAPCDGAPPSGLLMQTPNKEQTVTLTINEARLQFAGTLFLQTPDGLTVNVLDGFARLESAAVERYIPAGASVWVDPSGESAPAEPYTFEDVSALPVMFLENRFSIPQPLTAADIERLTAQANAPVIEATEEVMTGGRCHRTVRLGEYLFDGPGEQYEQLDFLEPRQRVYPIGQTTDEDGVVWWQIRPDGYWIQAAGIDSEGDCPTVPEAAFVTLPGTNTLQLDTCTTTNGPILSGQEVTITFIPRVWGTFEEAELATARDRGRITVGSRRLRVVVDGPVRIGEYRYIRAFSGVWIARPGTFRVSGTHLAYQIICNINVPVGR